MKKITLTTLQHLKLLSLILIIDIIGFTMVITSAYELIGSILFYISTGSYILYRIIVNKPL